MADALTDELKLRYRITRAVRKSDLPSPSRLIMFVLADVADTGTAEIPPQRTPSVAVLAEETGLDRRTVQRHLDSLEESGWLTRTRPSEREQWFGHRVRYRLLLLGGVAAVDHVEVAGDHGVAAEDRTRAAEDHPDGGTEPPLDRSTDLTDEDQIKPPLRVDVEQLCTHLADRIEGNGSKRPNITGKWRDAARLLLDKDGRTVEQVLKAIDWCQDDQFWCANVLSMPKLRAKYDQLRLAAQRSGARASPPSNVRHIDDLTPEQRAARNPFANATRASETA